VASLLVYVALDVLGEVLDLTRRDTGDVWHLGRNDLRNQHGDVMAELDRLDDDATLFIATLDGDRPIVVGWAEDFDFDADGFTGADVRLREHDLGDLLPRLGCASDLATFARPPRVLPPGDVDLLRYALALADDRVRPPPPPEPIVAEDTELATLRAAVLADPTSDEPREIYADALQARGDPRGELIALQLQRAASGRHLPSQRERILVERIGDAILGPLAPYIAGFELTRGFLSSCTTRHMPDAIARDPRWSTVENLFTDDRGLLFNPELRAKRLGIRGAELLLLSRSPHALPYSMIGGWVDLGRRELPRAQTGVHYEGDFYAVMRSPAFANLRVLSIDQGSLPQDRSVRHILDNPVGQKLEHLDVWLRRDQPPRALVAELDASALPVLTLRGLLPAATRYGASPRILLGFVRGHVVLEVHTPLVPAQLDLLLAVITPLIADRTQIDLVDGSLTDEPTDPVLVARLRAFMEVTRVPTAESLAP